MDLTQIVSITGKPGLYQVVSRTNNSLIVESLDEKRKKMPISASYQIALLSDITLYTTTMEDLTLEEVFKRIRKEEGLEISVKPKDDAATLRRWFEGIAPEHDAERVYSSDIKKLVKWYIMLVNEGIITEKDEEETESETEQTKGGEESSENED